MSVTALADRRPAPVTLAAAPPLSDVQATIRHLQEQERLGRRLAFLNNKGGVGKTALCLELGLALVRKGRRVLFVDMEPQANLTRRLNVLEIPEVGTMAQVLDRPTKGGAAAAIVPCGWDIPGAEMISVLPAAEDLADRETEAAIPASHNRLNRALYGVTDQYDYTLFDCRPSLGHLEQMVVATLEQQTDGFYVPVEPANDAISGAYRVIEKVAAWADQLDVAAPVLGILVNLVDSRTNLHQGRIQHLPASLDGAGGHDHPPILEPHIPRAVRIAELHDLAQPSTGDNRMRREGHLERFDQLAKVVDAA